jgi:hypothetical protein
MLTVASRRTYHKKFAQWGIGKRPNDRSRTCILDTVPPDDDAEGYASHAAASGAENPAADGDLIAHGHHVQYGYGGSYAQAYGQTASGSLGAGYSADYAQFHNHPGAAYTQEHHVQSQYHSSSSSAMDPYAQDGFGWGPAAYDTSQQHHQAAQGHLPPADHVVPSHGTLDYDQQTNYASATSSAPQPEGSGSSHSAKGKGRSRR